MGENLRRMPRERRRLRVQLEEVNIASFTADVSPGGFCIEAMQVLPKGTTVHGTIGLGSAEFPFTGKIAWALAPDSRIGKRGRMGVQFTGIANDFFVAYQKAFET